MCNVYCAMFFWVLISIASRLLYVVLQIIEDNFYRICRSARIRTLSTCIEYPKKSEIDDFNAFEAVFAKNSGTKLVLNFKTDINHACFPYWYSVCYASLNGSGVEPLYRIRVCGALNGYTSKGCECKLKLRKRIEYNLESILVTQYSRTLQSISTSAWLQSC